MTQINEIRVRVSDFELGVQASPNDYVAQRLIDAGVPLIATYRNISGNVYRPQRGTLTSSSDMITTTYTWKSE